MRNGEEELLKLKYKAKFSILPISIMKQERRMFGSGVFEERRNQSLSHTKKINIMKNLQKNMK